MVLRMMISLLMQQKSLLWINFRPLQSFRKQHFKHNVFAKNAKAKTIIGNPPMDLDDLHTFTRVVELGSLSGAARERDVPVSQISRALTRLEAQHKVRLLHRSTHALSLTEAGQSLLDHGKRMLESYAQFEADVGDSAHVAGVVNLGVSAAMAHYVIIPSLSALAKKHPQLSIDLHVDDRMVDMAQQGIDMAIRTGDPGSDALVARKIGEHGRRLYAAPSYVAAHGMPNSLETLAQHRLITNSVQHQLNRWPFLVNGQAVTHIARGHYRASSTGIMMTMVLAGLGLVRGNTAICEPMVARGQLVRVMDDLVECQTVPINAVMLQERHRAPKIRACIDFFAQWLAQH
jgi:DNA-binding transcriptional LysR family regulator